MKKLLTFLKNNYSTIIAIVLFVLFAIYMTRNIDYIIDTFNVAVANMTRYFVVYLGLIVLSFYFFIRSYQIVFRMNNVKRSLKDLSILKMIEFVVNIIIPTAGLSVLALYTEDAKKRGESTIPTFTATTMTYISDFTSISIFLILSVVYLLFIHALLPHVAIAAIIFLAITIASYFLVYLAGKGSKIFKIIIGSLFNFIEKLLVLFTKKKVGIDKYVERLYEDFKNLAGTITKDPTDWFMAIFYACLQHLMAIFAIYIIFVSFGYYPRASVILAGYSVASMFVVVSPTPSGIGFVEGSFILIFTQLGIPSSLATTVTLIYRAFSFWLPMFVGFFLYQRERIKEIIKRKDYLKE